MATPLLNASDLNVSGTTAKPFTAFTPVGLLIFFLLILMLAGKYRGFGRVVIVLLLVLIIAVVLRNYQAVLGTIAQ